MPTLSQKRQVTLPKELCDRCADRAKSRGDAAYAGEPNANTYTFGRPAQMLRGMKAL